MNMYVPALAIFLLFTSACISEEKKNEEGNRSSVGYFSIRDYIKDQWKTHRGQPFGIIKVVQMNDKVDSVFTNVLDIELGRLIELFVEADISDPKYLGQYEFANFAEDKTMSINYIYEANNAKLYTQRMQIMVDDITQVAKSIYIETRKETKLNIKEQKLTYLPTKRISIYEQESSKVGPTKEVKIDYIFL